MFVGSNSRRYRFDAPGEEGAAGEVGEAVEVGLSVVGTVRIVVVVPSKVERPANVVVEVQLHQRSCDGPSFFSLYARGRRPKTPSQRRLGAVPYEGLPP
jgi:hypothetical protein